jgi:hypothetical protein
MLYTWVIEKLTPLLTMCTLRTLMEQIEMYRLLITDLMTSCMLTPNLYGAGNMFGGKKYSGIDEVNYVDIIPETIKQTSETTNNC